MTFKLFSLLVSGILLIGGVVFAVRYFTSNSSKESAPQTVVSEQKKLIIAAFGDSLTAGYGVTLEESYPALLQARLQEKGVNSTILNMGVSGETTSGGRERIEFVLAQNPDIILLGLGANDMLRTLPVAEARANLKFIIEGLQKENKKVVLLGMKSTLTNGLAYSREFNDMYSSLAKEYSLPLVPFFLEGVALVPELNTGDGIHPNRSGYQIIVDNNIMPILLPYIQRNFIVQ